MSSSAWREASRRGWIPRSRSSLGILAAAASARSTSQPTSCESAGRSGWRGVARKGTEREEQRASPRRSLARSAAGAASTTCRSGRLCDETAGRSGSWPDCCSARIACCASWRICSITACGVAAAPVSAKTALCARWAAFCTELRPVRSRFRKPSAFACRLVSISSSDLYSLPGVSASHNVRQPAPSPSIHPHSTSHCHAAPNCRGAELLSSSSAASAIVRSRGRTRGVSKSATTSRSIATCLLSAKSKREAQTSSAVVLSRTA
mmetsp:Transcript_38266/g.113757  ORF Transcript_38266/g.113757 Transcript_38266/m.113757 type:complete len:264 (-) Transcript_38266:160-951(-)